jgi:hypothetical protein
MSKDERPTSNIQRPIMNGKAKRMKINNGRRSLRYGRLEVLQTARANPVEGLRYE